METASLMFWVFLFFAWLLYLVLQAVFINGVKLAAGGSTEMRPDGTEQDSEMILYPLAKELLKKKVCKIFYNGERLAALYAGIIKNVQVLKGASVMEDMVLFTSADQRGQFIAAQPMLSKYIPEGAISVITENSISFYKEYDVYKYPAFIRKPVIQCVVCMGSFYGLFTFLLPGLVISNWSLVIVPAYLVNTFMLACVNKLVFKMAQGG